MKKVSILRTTSIAYLIVAILSITFLDAHPQLCVLTIICLMGANGYSEMCGYAKAELDNDLYEHSNY